MRASRLAVCCALFGGALAGCVSHGALIAPALTSQANRKVELSATPFFPQRALQCGPASLATVLGAAGATTTPDELESLVYLPERHGSLQVEMQAAPRRFARLSYTLGNNLSDVLSEIDAGRPVLVLHNYGLPVFPRWHYAVVVGYDAEKESLVLRSGATQRQMLSAGNFMRAWDNGGRWALVILRPGELPANADRVRYLEAAAAFERSARPEDARLAFEAAVQRWPDEPIAWVGRGTANYRAHALPAAAEDYAKAVRLDPAQYGARNNLAMTLLDLDCPQSARAELEKIDAAKISGALADAVGDTRAQIAARGDTSDGQTCPSVNR